jgi:hypothetical protein
MSNLTRNWVQKGSGKPPPEFGDLFFFHEIEMQCDFAIRAHGEMRTVHSTNAKHPSLLALAHVVLVFSGNAEKLLVSRKSAPKESRDRTERLRKALSVEAADLSEIADARNYLEHFDERLDRYLKVPGGMVVHRFIQDHEPLEMKLDDGRVLKPRFLQLLNTTDWYLNLHGDRVDLEKIVQKIQGIHAKVRSELKRKGVPGYEDAL